MSDKAERTSKYQALEKPEFKSTIPAHLVDKLSPETRWMVESLSRIESAHEWLIKAALEGNRIDLDTDIRTQEIEDWKAMVTSKWAVICVFLAALLPLVLEKILDHLGK